MMTNWRWLLSASALLLMSACDVDKPAKGGEVNSAQVVESGADEKAIREKVDHWVQLVKAKDSPAIAALYADDGAVMPPNGPIEKGHDAIQKTWAAMMGTPGFDLTFTPEQIIVSSSGDMALDRGTYKLAIAPKGRVKSDTGKYVVVWRKVGGEWKAAADIFNSDMPPAA